MQMDKDIFNYVNQELSKLEVEFNIHILYAVETGSRGWGFANKSSDYDVRFYYLRPLEDYLRIDKIRDVIDINDLGKRDYKYDLDFSGWDITKVLALHRQSNPNLREHLLHSMVYRGDCKFLNGLPDFDIPTLKHAYGSMTYGNYMKYIKKAKTDDFSSRVVKTYCYCIRQILAWLLIDKYNTTDVPVHIDDLLSKFKEGEDYQGLQFGSQLLEDMQTCIDYYRSDCSSNKLSERAIMNLSTWINTFLDISKTQPHCEKRVPSIEIYNERFRQILYGYYKQQASDTNLWVVQALKLGIINENEAIKMLQPVKPKIEYQ